MTATRQIWTAHLDPGEALQWQGKAAALRPWTILMLFGAWIILSPLQDALPNVNASEGATTILSMASLAMIVLCVILFSNKFLPIHYALTDRRALRLATRWGQSELQSVLRAGAYATAMQGNVTIHAQNGKKLRFQMHSFKQSMWLLTQIGTIAPLLSAPK